MLDACSCSGRAAVAKSTKRILTSSHFYSAAAEQRRDFTLPCVHPRAGRQCIALTKRKACRASLLSRWAKRVTRRRCLEQPDEHTGRRAKRKKAKEKSIDAEPRALDARGFRRRQRLLFFLSARSAAQWLGRTIWIVTRQAPRRRAPHSSPRCAPPSKRTGPSVRAGTRSRRRSTATGT